MNWILLCAFSCRLFASSFENVTPSTPDEIASFNIDLVANGFVSVISGGLFLEQTDLRVKGAQDLLLTRTYISPQILGSYYENENRDRLALGKSLQQLHTKGWVVFPHLWAGYNLNSLYFQVRDPLGACLEFQIIGNRGYLKTASYGCTNLRNEKPSSEADIRNIELWVEGPEVKILWPTGLQRIYIKQPSGIYRLDAELLPNGKAIRYRYDERGLIRVSSTDLSGKYTYASIDKTSDEHYKGSDGREAKNFYELREIKGQFKQNNFKEKGTYSFPVLTHVSNPTYASTMDYNERTLLKFYDKKEYPISCSYFQTRGVPCRIQNFSCASDTTSFSYEPPIAGHKEGATVVTHPNGSQTIYRFNSNLLVTAIENWLEGKLYTQKLFSYDSKQHIAKIETKDGKGCLRLSIAYECDAAGNALSETHYGDFGTFTIKRAFSKNRVVWQEDSHGLGYKYTYLNDTQLLTSKTTLFYGKEIRKTEYMYDEANNLIEEAEVGKTITTYTLYQDGEHLHRPEWKEEKDWDGHLIHKTYFRYDQFGNLTEEKHYGADGVFAYLISKIYDAQDNLIEETNALGQTASYRYDARGRQIETIPFSNRLVIQRTFDEKGRLITLQEGAHATQFAYNSSDELIEKIDYLGLATRYRYHKVHHKPISIEEEPTLLEIVYDDFGREIERKDAYGSTTYTQHNSYGDPIVIIYPDGGKEVLQYDSNRTLVSKTDPDGLISSYTYDPLKRLLSETIGSRKTLYFYDAYNLIEEKDPLGISTYYKYNLLSQKKEATRDNHSTYFTYDSLGFLAKTKNNARWTSYQNDVLGRVIGTSVDGCINTFYTYDPAGNLASKTGQYATYFVYDPYNRLVETIYPDGAKTRIAYEEGYKSVTKKITDPKGAEKIEVYNAQGLLLRKEVPGCNVEEFSYDLALRLVSHDHLTFTYTPQGFMSSMTEGARRSTFWTYTPGGKIHTKRKPDGALLHYCYNSEGELANVGSREFRYDDLGRLIQGSGFTREYDAFGNITKETFSTGLSVETSYDDSFRPLTRVLPDRSSIAYEYEGPFLKNIHRMNADGVTSYTHTYDQFDTEGRVLSETGLFTTSYGYDPMGRRIFQSCPYFAEDLVYDLAGNLIQKGNQAYTYDAADQLIASIGEFSFSYDAHANRTFKNQVHFKIDGLNQMKGFPYDANGNMAYAGFAFDEFDQLIQAGGETFIYDALGRRIQKGNTSYLYFGDEEVGAFNGIQAKELKIPGSLSPIALEIQDKLYYPIADVQGTIRFLIDPKTAKICKKNTCDAFGFGLSPDIPYAYAGKRYDPQTRLIYFGKRYYDPSLGRWLTPDPLGSIDHSNLYQYVFNNPFRYQDPNGESIGGYLLGLGEIILGGAIIVGGFALEVATLGGFTIGLGVTTKAGLALMGLGAITTTYHAQDIKSPTSFWKNTNVYVPDRPLPNTPDGIPIPETDAPHTQLGTQERKRKFGEKYPQAREFDKNGTPIKTIDFTDHDRPQNHPNPHEHPCETNPTGGTPRRGSGKPLENWKY